MRSNSFKSFCIFLVLIVLSASLCGCYDKKSCDEILRSADKLSKSLLDGDADTLRNHLGKISSELLIIYMIPLLIA